MLELSERIADFAAADLPRIAWVELTSKCPFDCIFCSRRFRRGVGRHLDFEVCKSLMQEMQDPEIIRLNYSGESIHYPHLIEAIAMARDAGAQTELVSVLSTATHSLIRDLVRSGLDRLTISLHAMHPNQFENIYRFSSIEQLRETIAYLIEARRDLEIPTPHLDFAFVAMKANLSELASVASYAHEMGIEEISVLPVIRRDPIPLEFLDELSAGKLREPFKEELRQAVLLAQHVAKGVRIRVCSPEVEPEHRLEPFPQNFPQPLPAGAMIYSCEQNPWETVHVLSDGSVVACERQDRLALGNLHRQSLREIWHGDAYRDLRRRYLAGGISECVECPWKQAFLPSPLNPQVSACSTGPQLFRGWHELDGSGTRWSKKDAVVVLGGEGASSAVRCSGALPSSADGAENGVVLTCNGTTLGRVMNPTNALIHFDCCLGGLPCSSGPFVFSLITQTLFRPAHAGIKGDSRAVGIALYQLELIDEHSTAKRVVSGSPQDWGLWKSARPIGTE